MIRLLIFIFLTMADNMEEKAGPPELPEWNAPPKSKWRAQATSLLKVFTAAVLILVAYALYVWFLDGHPDVRWRWMSKPDLELELERGGPEGSKYLLGVGKADITGYEALFSFELGTDCMIDQWSRST